MTPDPRRAILINLNDYRRQQTVAEQTHITEAGLLMLCGVLVLGAVVGVGFMMIVALS